MNKYPHSREAALRANRGKRPRKRIAALTCLALAGVLTAGGAVAFIATMSDKVENSFTPTEVSCKVDETMSGNVKKEVSIENTGTTDAFIRAEIIVNWVKLDDDGKSVVSVLGTAPIRGTDYELELSSSGEWTAEMDDGFYYFKESVAPSTALKKSLTDELISYCEPIKAAPVDGYVLRVDVIAEAVQAAGSDNTKTPVDSWDNDLVEVKRSDDGKSISAANRSGQGA